MGLQYRSEVNADRSSREATYGFSRVHDFPRPKTDSPLETGNRPPHSAPPLSLGSIKTSVRDGSRRRNSTHYVSRGRIVEFV